MSHLPTVGHLIGGKIITSGDRAQDVFNPATGQVTGSVALEEFRREHTLEYQRLSESGELSKHLVDAPSQPMTVASRVLGITLICFGLILLIFVVIGFLGSALIYGLDHYAW